MSGNIEYCSIDDKEHEDKFAARSCPVCPDQPMRKIDLLAYTDTIFDYCPSCEGFYPLVPMIYETTSLLRLVLGRGGFDG